MVNNQNVFANDVCTRWNSTFKLIFQSIDYKNLLYSFASQYIPSSNLLPNTSDICATNYANFTMF